MRRRHLLAVLGCFGVAGAGSALAQSGTQVINGTTVFTQVFPRDGIAMFSNDCGSQTLTQRELQQGAIPDRIIPCPRPGGPSQQSRHPYADPRTEAQRRTDARIAMEVWQDATRDAEAAKTAVNKEDWQEASIRADGASFTSRSLDTFTGMRYIKETIPDLDDRIQYNHCMANILGVITNPQENKYDASECVGHESDPTIVRLTQKMRSSK